MVNFISRWAVTSCSPCTLNSWLLNTNAIKITLFFPYFLKFFFLSFFFFFPFFFFLMFFSFNFFFFYFFLLFLFMHGWFIWASSHHSQDLIHDKVKVVREMTPLLSWIVLLIRCYFD